MARIQQHYSLKAHNSFGLEATARAFCTVETVEELQTILHTEARRFAEVRILGGGSNILLTGDVSALVIGIGIRGMTVLSEAEETIEVEVSAGEIWDDWVQYAVEQDWGGMENLSLIPGSVGASPVQNIGAYGVELRESVVAVKGLKRSSGEPFVLRNAECAFAYRDSIFKQALREQVVITSVILRLRKHPESKHLRTEYGAVEQEITRLFPELTTQERSIYHVREAVCSIRRSKLPDPAFIGNAGSFFKNPEVPIALYRAITQTYPEAPSYTVSDSTVKLPAAWLIEQCGWKGKRLNPSSGAAVHDKQALVLVNHGTARGEEILELSRCIQRDVEERFGVVLSAEVNVW
ncbi:MAG: UDP-N-acetylmuramate dehydrogenase [Candidatus Kapabacteria bacterium]|jgi:UDP-N-acetylmuramate dehydrogenase|nr:UDP-N-acetylmuramate dehydrogenase [Candidatus Kapabacteria bacterium]